MKSFLQNPSFFSVISEKIHQKLCSKDHETLQKSLDLLIKYNQSLTIFSDFFKITKENAEYQTLIKIILVLNPGTVYSPEALALKAIELYFKMRKSTIRLKELNYEQTSLETQLNSLKSLLFSLDNEVKDLENNYQEQTSANNEIKNINDEYIKPKNESLKAIIDKMEEFSLDEINEIEVLASEYENIIKEFGNLDSIPEVSKLIKLYTDFI